MKDKTRFSFYGVTLLVESDNPGLIDLVRHDFSYFLEQRQEANANADADVKVSYYNVRPDYEALPEMTGKLATPRNITFSDSGKFYIDYFGKALNISDREKNNFSIYTLDPALGREIVYLTVISRICELLEKRGLHRIHALGLECDQKGVLILLPSGGGKTTLAMSVLASQENRCKLISEDSPLVDLKGMLYPFPLRIGMLPESLPEKVPAAFVRNFQRRASLPKVTVNIDYFKKRICAKAVSADTLIIGVRSTMRQPQIKQVSKIQVLKYCLMNSVIGVGLYQGMEFIMQKNFRETIKFTGIIFSRLITNLKLLTRANTFVFIMSREAGSNLKTLEEFLNGHAPSKE